MSETLESIAQALFRSWFVDFDLVPSKADRARRRLGTVADLARPSRETIDPGTRPDETFDLFSIPAFDAGRSPERRLGSEIKSHKLLVPDGSILVSKLNPRIPRVWWPTVRPGRSAICSTEFLVLVPADGISLEYLFALTSDPAFSKELEAGVTGTSGSHQRVKLETVLGTSATIPDDGAMSAFTEITRPLYARSRLAREETETLAALRDALLPKLISGELRVGDADRLVENSL
jgi:type I restriction enzyme S subunit